MHTHCTLRIAPSLQVIYEESDTQNFVLHTYCFSKNICYLQFQLLKLLQQVLEVSKVPYCRNHCYVAK